MKNYTEYAVECAEQLGQPLDALTSPTTMINYDQFKNNMLNDYLLNDTNVTFGSREINNLSIIKSNVKNDQSMQIIFKQVI